MPVDNNDIVVIEDVIMSKNMSTFGIAVITLIFKLERLKIQEICLLF